MFPRNSAAGLAAVALGVFALGAQAQVHVVDAPHGADSHHAAPAPRVVKAAHAAPRAEKTVRAAHKPAPHRVAAKSSPVRHAPAAHAVPPPAAAAVARTAARPALAPPSEQEVALLFDLWNAALQTGNPELVASLYAPDAVLLPTVSNRVRTSRAQIADYFHHFLALEPRGVINQQFIRILGPDLALNAGVYTFDLVRDGKPEQVTARYDFLYKRVNGRWLIVDHHSSKMPEPVTAHPVQTAAVAH